MRFITTRSGVLCQHCDRVTDTGISVTVAVCPYCDTEVDEDDIRDHLENNHRQEVLNDALDELTD